VNEKAIWDFLMEKTNNPYGTAAIMGNLMAESSLNPLNATGTKNPSYTQDVDNGIIDFVGDNVAYGIAQWRYWSRKEKLLELSKKKRKSVGDLSLQLEFLWSELQSHKTALNAVLTATDIRTPSDIFMLKYEKPGNTGEKARQKRATYAHQYFNSFAKNPDTKPGYHQVTATANVNIRLGNDTSYDKAGVLRAGYSAQWVATSENNWYAIKYEDKVCWVSGEFAKLTQ